MHDLVAALSRVSRAYAHAIWNTDHTVTFVAKPLVEKGFPRSDVGIQMSNGASSCAGCGIGPY